MNNKKTSKKTLVIGASENPSRYANKAIHRLLKNDHEVVAIGKKTGKVSEVEILTGLPELKDIDTVTLYINPTVQKEYESYIISLNPKRIIFNPGTENPAFIQRARKEGILTKIACTLVMLSIDNY